MCILLDYIVQVETDRKQNARGCVLDLSGSGLTIYRRVNDLFL